MNINFSMWKKVLRLVAIYLVIIKVSIYNKTGMKQNVQQQLKKTRISVRSAKALMNEVYTRDVR